jgi:predicted HicB family RNase H-like nuclease
LAGKEKIMAKPTDNKITTTLRIPEDLRDKIKKIAIDEKVSFNDWILDAIEKKIKK